MIAAIVMFIVSTVVSLAMSHHEQAKMLEDGPQAPDNVKIPKVSSTGYLPVVFGTRRLSSPNVVWYGGQASAKVEKSTGVWIEHNFITEWNEKIENKVTEWFDKLLDSLGL